MLGAIKRLFHDFYDCDFDHFFETYIFNTTFKHLSNLTPISNVTDVNKYPMTLFHFYFQDDHTLFIYLFLKKSFNIPTAHAHVVEYCAVGLPSVTMCTYACTLPIPVNGATL